MSRGKKHRKARALTRAHGGGLPVPDQIAKRMKALQAAQRVTLPRSDLGLLALSVLDSGGAVGDRALATYMHRKFAKV